MGYADLSIADGPPGLEWLSQSIKIVGHQVPPADVPTVEALEPLTIVVKVNNAGASFVDGTVVIRIENPTVGNPLDDLLSIGSKNDRFFPGDTPVTITNVQVPAAFANKHKCILADVFTPEASATQPFDVLAEQHVAQLNLNIGGVYVADPEQGDSGWSGSGKFEADVKLHNSFNEEKWYWLSITYAPVDTVGSTLIEGVGLLPEVLELKGELERPRWVVPTKQGPIVTKKPDPKVLEGLGLGKGFVGRFVGGQRLLDAFVNSAAVGTYQAEALEKSAQEFRELVELYARRADDDDGGPTEGTGPLLIPAQAEVTVHLSTRVVGEAVVMHVAQHIVGFDGPTGGVSFVILGEGVFSPLPLGKKAS